MVRRDRPRPGVEDGTLTVAVVDNADPEWEEKFHDAMSTARMRAAALNSETEPGLAALNSETEPGLAALNSETEPGLAALNSETDPG